MSAIEIYVNNAILNIELSTRAILAKAVAPAISGYLDILTKAYEEYNGYHLKAELLEQLEVGDLSNVSDIIAELGIENADEVAKYLNLANDIYSLHQNITEKLKLANQLINSELDILSDEYKAILDQFNNLDIENLLQEFTNIYVDQADSLFQELQADINRFTNQVNQSVVDITNLAGDITNSYDTAVAEYAKLT